MVTLKPSPPRTRIVTNKTMRSAGGVNDGTVTVSQVHVSMWYPESSASSESLNE